MKKGQLSRINILQVAIDLFSEKGYHDTSTQEIADKCGISQTTIFYHFKNKKTLFGEILNYVISNNRNIFEQLKQDKDDPYDCLVTLIRANIKWCMEYPEQTKIILLLFNFSASDDDFKMLATKTIDKGRSLILIQLDKLQEHNKIKSHLSIFELSVIIQQYVNGVLFQLLVRTDRELTFKTFESVMNVFLQTVLGIRLDEEVLST
ncbi:MAG: TetR/AcrR family transcriptional regulator [Halobacteriovoraceae bacterium]|jgi:TetR/AcrR family transcriptional regulator, fatty acid metabolism regulator protein|nr:TetR/AcrR family transcriptional regulator [Halobacteriovoraceae bacterium]